MFEAILAASGEAGERLAALVACAGTVAADARGASGWDPAVRVAALGALDAAVAAVAEARAHLLVADREGGSSQLPGDRSYEAARARLTRAGVGDARREVQQADVLVSMPVVAAGVRDGSVPLGHLDVLARAAAGASEQVAAVLRSAEVQHDVVGLARVHAAPDFARAVARFVAGHDPAALEAAHQDAYRERFLAVSAQPHGVFLKGRLDVTAGQSLLVALDAMGQHPDESRSPGQASADALVMLAERLCAGTPATPEGGQTRHGAGIASPDAAGSTSALAVRVLGEDAPDGVAGATGQTLSGTSGRPHLSLLVPAETFAQLLAHDQARHATTHTGTHAGAGTGAGAGAVAGRRLRAAPDRSPVAPAVLEDGTPVAMSELARALCDADITRIVMAADSQPLDVGRTRRLHTPAQRKAVIARDQQCAWNGCQTPAARCEVHHIRWWHRDNGPTDIEHATLACRHHHGEIHRQDLNIQRLPHPPGTDPGTPMRYVFRTPDRTVINAPPRWIASGAVASGGWSGAGGESVPGLVGSDAGSSSSSTVAGAARETRVAGAARETGVSGWGVQGTVSPTRDARREAREHAAFTLFESDGPPPAWATG